MTARRTDHGRVMIFPVAIMHLAVCVGKLPSSMIVARGMTLITIISIPELPGRLKDGHLAEINGITDTSTRIDDKEAAA